MQIKAIRGREILDSRGNPTVEAEVILSSGIQGRASVPSGASTGSKEASELRDKDESRFAGKGVQQAVAHINHDLNHFFKNKEFFTQTSWDEALIALDNSANKTRLGANTLLAVSLAFARALAKNNQKPLYLSLNEGETMLMPVPMMNVLNGGAHADNNIDIQEFMLMPIGAPSFSEALRMGVEVFHVLKNVLKQKGLNTAVGDEGGFAPNLRSNREALDLLSTAVEKTGYRLGQDLVFALDVAASELMHEGLYQLKSENKKFTSEALVGYYQELVKSYPIASIEDGLDEQDWSGWHLLTKALGSQIQLVGDDLFVTNSEILQEGIAKNIANAILIKPNQIGSISETKAALKLAFANNYRAVVSHRSGETEDSFIADLAVACGCGQIKTGSACRSDRIAKYNQLLRIEEQAGFAYAGKTALAHFR